MPYLPTRTRAYEQTSDAKLLHGEYALAVQSGAVTVLVAGGALLSLRNPDATKKISIRYINASFVCTTAFTAAQAMGLDAAIARSFSVVDTGGTAIDLTTVVDTNKRRQGQATSAITANCARVASTTAIVAGTRVLDTNALFSQQGFIGAVGATLSLTLLDSRDDGVSTSRAPIILAQNEGLVLRNTVLMGATGVGTWVFQVEWDEITV